MKRSLWFALLAAICTTPATIALADEAAEKAEILHWIKDAETKLIQLAEATPEGKFAWRPSKGVRSVAEVYMHVAAANFGMPSFAGTQPPAGFDFAKFEGSASKKADVVKQLKDSFVHAEKSLTDLNEEAMEKKVNPMGMGEMSTGGLYLMLLSHAHEHLGQSIAYARINGIVPPWSRTADAPAEAKEKASDAPKKTGM